MSGLKSHGLESPKAGVGVGGPSLDGPQEMVNFSQANEYLLFRRRESTVLCWRHLFSLTVPDPAQVGISLCWLGVGQHGGGNISGAEEFWGGGRWIGPCHSSAGQILTLSPTWVTQAPRICTCNIVGADMSSSTEMAGVWHGVRGQKSPYSDLGSSPHLPCAGYSTCNLACLFVQVRIAP